MDKNKGELPVAVPMDLEPKLPKFVYSKLVEETKLVRVLLPAS